MEGCYRALLYPPSLPNTPFAECIYRLQINEEFKKKIYMHVPVAMELSEVVQQQCMI
jgi:hypothetical protein